MSKPLRELVVASANPGKAAELAELLRGLPVQVRSLADFPGISLPEETGTSFAENAALKATVTARALGAWVLADDSGLVVPALDGAPGLHSSRVAPSDPERIAWVLERMAGVPEAGRAAAFVCVIALADDEGRLRGTWEGRAEGMLLTAPRGERGFGYDPIFLHPPSGKSFGEMTAAEKSAVSHRGQALRRLREELAARWPEWGDKEQG